MTDDRRMSTDRFYGDVDERVSVLQNFLSFVAKEHPTREQIYSWLDNERDGASQGFVDRNIGFLEKMNLIEIEEETCLLGQYGKRFNQTGDRLVLLEAFRSGYKGFDTILEALHDEPRTVEEIEDLIVAEFDDASTGTGMERHLQWLQAMGYVEREGEKNLLTDYGRAVVDRLQLTERPRLIPPATGDATSDWLDLLRQHCSARSIPLEINEKEDFQARIRGEHPINLRVHHSDIEREAARIRVDKEISAIRGDGDQEIISIVLDTGDYNQFDPVLDNFIYLTSELLSREASTDNSIEISVSDVGTYDETFAGRVNNWHDLLEILSRASEEESGDGLPKTEGLSSLLRRALIEYPTDQIGEAISEHPSRDLIEKVIPQQIRAVLDDEQLLVKSSTGKGRWTAIPWIAVLDPRETRQIQEGVYIVFLLEPEEGRIRLTLNQGVTSVKNESGTVEAREELIADADKIRQQIPLLGFSEGPIEFPNASSRNELYGPGTIYYNEYSIGELPSDETAVGDLHAIAEAYQKYVSMESAGAEPRDGYWNMVMKKRRLANDFLENPSEELFRELVDSDHFWGSMAYRAWPDELFAQHTPEEVADLFREARETDSIQTVLELHHVGESKATEILRALAPSEFAILNKRSRNGMSELGYTLPESNPSDEEYQEFTEMVQEAYDEYNLRELMEEEMEEQIPPDATTLEIADWAFSEYQEGNIDVSILGKEDNDDLQSPVVDPEKRRPPKAWQAAPDQSLDLWAAWVDEDVMSIGWSQAGDLRDLSKEEIAAELDTDTSSNNVTTLYYFANSILPGDVIVARHGRNKIDGIGVVMSEYYHNEEKASSLFPESQSHHYHLVDVDWIIDFVADYEEPNERPDSLPMFAMETIRGYSHYEELKAKLIEQYPELTESLSVVEERQSELSTEYWAGSEAAGEYSGIEEATKDIVRRLQKRERDDRNWLSDLILESVVLEWSDVLRRNDLVDGDIEPDDRAVFEQLLTLYEDNEARFEQYADELGAGWVGDLTNRQTLFVVLFRDLQDRAGVSRLNFNHVKMRQLLNGRHVDEVDTPLSNIPAKPADAVAIERQLTRAGQLVFHGPPGTGKTYTALRFARWWLDQETAEPSEAQLETVTFHPSFTYEDFIEGLTAEEQDGAVEYSVESGVFKRFCDRAREAYDEVGDDAEPYVLVIDEINRGNLAQIFGETITLLEPDKRLGADNETATTLPHSKDRFRVPPNLYLIGTMNTADRSIALVDAALRRRFRFIEFPPKMKVLYDEHSFSGAAYVESAAISSSDPVRQLLALSIKGLEGLNEAILDAPNLGKGKQVGHSYLIDVDEGDTVEERLQSIVDAWQYEILPLLEEYYFGQFDRIKQDLFDGGGGRLFNWDTEQIKSFEANDLAHTLITLTETETDWAGGQPASLGTAATYQNLLDADVLRQGDGLVFNPDKLPDDATRSFDRADSFWRCEVTGESRQQDQVKWEQNGELYPLADLSRQVLEEVSDFDGEIDVLEIWMHPRFDGRTLAELGVAKEDGDLGTPGVSATEEAGE